MISNTPKTILVDGVEQASAVYKRNESEVVDANIYVASGDGNKLGAFAITVTDEIVVYFIKPIVLHEASIYNISGVVSHGDMTVFLSSGFTKGSIDALKDNVIASAYADAEGNFNFSNISCKTGTVSMWIAVLAQEAPTISLSYEVAITDYNPNIGELLTHSFIEPEGEYENPLYTITGTCSTDIEKIYVSCTEDGTNVASLMETMCSSVVPNNGAYEIKCSGDYDQNYIVWAVTKTGGSLVVDNIVIKEDNSTCLSGDTMITMADGSIRRMDSLCVGEIVLSEEGLPSRIHTVRRGHFSSYHTLYRFEDGTVIDETHPHRFYNVDQGFWQRLQLWNIGDHAINQDGKEIALVSIERLEEEAEMFGIWTDSGTYYANGLLSGAASCNKKLLAEATAEQAIDMMLSTDEDWLLQLMGLEGGLPL